MMTMLDDYENVTILNKKIEQAKNTTKKGLLESMIFVT